MDRRQFLKTLGAGFLATVPCVNALALPTQKVVGTWSGEAFTPEFPHLLTSERISGVISIYTGKAPRTADTPSGKCIMTIPIHR
jgi:hypothetical protein